MSLHQRLAAAVTPLPTLPPVKREWSSLGLPDFGWILLTDQRGCEQCASDVANRPCTGACIVAHHLPAESRAALGTCAQCDDAACAEVCPVDAVAQTAQGVVEIDQELCIGCRFCADACPNGALLFIDPYRTPVPAYSVPGYTSGEPNGELPYTVAKCTFCSDRLLQGQMPVCAEACPEAAIWVGNLDRNTATNGRQVVRLTDLLEQRRVQALGPGNRVMTLV
jgi:Fe-S-cluster-containing dehydrogenase component